MSVRPPGVVTQRLDDQVRRRRVGVANAQGDDVDALCALVGDLALQLGEQVRRQLSQACRANGAAQSASNRATRVGDSAPS
jgi:hypothetical protein